ncbi:MAG: response regulator transcription factor [Chloroflexi bacterium]|nr:response regulator transcription factor [Chloroflexota bacterium]
MTAPKVLVVDDEKAMRLSLSEIIRLDGCEVQAAASGEEALQLLSTNSFDLMLLDLKMPGMDGIRVLAETHRLSPQTVIILLTAHGTLDTAMQAIENQAFAYLLKPSAPDVIIDKVRRGLARRMEMSHKDQLINQIEQNLKELRTEVSPASAAPGPDSKPKLASGGGIVLDLSRREATVGGKSLHLTPTEFRLLTALMTRPDEVLTAQQLVREAQGYQADEREAREIIRPTISRLRSKLAQYPHSAKCLVSVRGQGYMFSERGG